ncbi:MAG TPA: peptidoglycan -binding protein [Stellaceae bacterium]|nr:peptidoglycan -binding protein [Stellaceae bacterium]
MARARARTQRNPLEAWPGYVDVLSTLLIVIVFMLAVFVLAQFFLSQVLSARNEELRQLGVQVGQLADQLAMEQKENSSLKQNVVQLTASLKEAEGARDTLMLKLADVTKRAETAEAAATKSADELKVQLAEAESLRRDIEALKKLRTDLEGQVAQLTGENGQLRDRSKELEAKLASEQEKTVLAQKDIEARDIRLSELQALYLASQQKVEEQGKASAEAQAQVSVLNQQVAALRQQLARLEEALETSEAKDKQSQAQIADLGKRLNLALARKVEELARYRSEFFGRLREILGERKDITIVGDRFIFQSEVLFALGSADISDDAKPELDALAATLLDIARKIPTELPWVLRIDGHTDARPIHTAQFPSNWELSTARAVAVTQYLIARGVPPERLAPTGFGEFHPIDGRSDEIAYRRNRRIEFKLTDR